MKEYICKEVQTENGGYLEIEKELIRCKECAYYAISGNEVNGFCRNLAIPFDSYEWCSRAEPKRDKE